MNFVNSFEVDILARHFRDDPILGPASATLANLRDWTDTHSDGWAYWPKPSRAAERLVTLLTNAVRQERDTRRITVTWDDVRRAYIPLRAFKTRHGADFEIVMVAQLSLFGRND